MPPQVLDAHRHLGALPPYGFYGGPPLQPAVRQLATVDQLMAQLDQEGTERALVIPNYGVPDPDLAFGFNELVLEAAKRDDRILAALWTSARPGDEERTEAALELAGESGVAALKLSFLLGGRPTEPACRPLLDRIFATALRHDLVVHVHTSPGAASDIDQVGHLVDWYGDDVAIHLVHLGGGMSGHIKLSAAASSTGSQPGRGSTQTLRGPSASPPAGSCPRSRPVASEPTASCSHPTSHGATARESSPAWSPPARVPSWHARSSARTSPVCTTAPRQTPERTRHGDHGIVRG